MPKGRGRAKVVPRVKKSYDCNDVESYLSRAICQVRNEFVPRMEESDRVHMKRLDATKDMLEETKAQFASKQTTLERDLDLLRAQMQSFVSGQEHAINRLTESVESLHKKLDAHLVDEAHSFDKLGQRLEDNISHVTALQQTLDDVSANGNKGLSASMRDIHNKLVEVEHATEGIRSRERFWKSLHGVLENTPLLKPLRSKFGIVIYVVIVILAINSVAHSLGAEFDVIGIFKWILSLIRSGG